MGVVYSILIDKLWFKLDINSAQKLGIAILFFANIMLIVKNHFEETSKKNLDAKDCESAKDSKWVNGSFNSFLIW